MGEASIDLYRAPYCRFLPENTRIFAYARSNLTSQDLHNSLRPYLKGGDSSMIDEFLATISYVQGGGTAPPPSHYHVHCSHLRKHWLAALRWHIAA